MGEQRLEKIWPQWKLGEVLGEGSFGKVYKGIREEHGLTTYSAIKIISITPNESEINSLRSEGMSEKEADTYLRGIVEDFVNEIKMMDSMKGAQGIVGVEDYQVLEKEGEPGWDIYIRMELLTGLVEKTVDAKLPEEEVIKVGLDLLGALEMCAQRSIIHRDIKPENIFVSSFGHYKLGDFGIARELEKTTGNMSQKGTFNYIAPEVAAGRNYDATVDIYSLGIVLYKLLNNNKLPFVDQTTAAVSYNDRKAALDRRLKGEPLPPPASASHPLAQAVLKACAYDPAERYATPMEFRKALEMVKNGQPIANFIPGASLDATLASNTASTTVWEPAPPPPATAPPPPVTQEAPPPAPVVQEFGKKRKPKKKMGIGAHIAAVFMCIFLALFAFVLLTVITVRVSFSEDAVIDAVSDINFTDLRVGQMLNLEGGAGRDDITLAEFIANEARDAGVDPDYFSRRDIVNLMDALPLDDFVGSIVARYAQAILTGDGGASITNREVLNFIEDNSHIIYRETGYQITVSDMDEIEEFMIDMNLSQVTRLDYIMEDIAVELDLVRWVLSWLALAVLGLVLLGFVLLILLICKRRLSAVFMYEGVTFTITGALYALLIFVIDMIVVAVVPAGVDRQLVNALLSGVQSIGVITGGIVAGVGLLMVLLAILFSKIARRKSA